jgi:hypothetical protein
MLLRKCIFDTVLMFRCGNGSDVLAVCFYCDGLSLPQRSCPDTPPQGLDKAYNLS